MAVALVLILGGLGCVTINDDLLGEPPGSGSGGGDPDGGNTSNPEAGTPEGGSMDGSGGSSGEAGLCSPLPE